MRESVSIDAHPIDEAVVVRYENGEKSQIINLKDLNDDVDINSLANMVLTKCSFIPTAYRQELEQVLFYLQKRKKNGNRIGSASSTDNSLIASCLKASIEDVESYVEMFYEDVPEKVRGVMCILELTKTSSNLPRLIANETLIGALARVFREDWKKSFELAINIAKVFHKLSSYNQFHTVLVHHKVGALCVNAVEYELKRGEAWKNGLSSSDEKTAKKCRLAIRKQHTLLSICLSILSNMASDLNIELKMIRRDLVPLLVQCLQYSTSNELLLSTVQFLLKVSIFEENKVLLENNSVVDRLVSLFPIDDSELRKSAIKLLFNLSFNNKIRSKMVSGGLVTNIAPLIQDDAKALNLLYQLSINDDAKAMITFTDAIQLLMRDLLSGAGSDVTKAILLNACVEKRNAQLVCGSNGQGLDLLMESALDNMDLLVAKIVRSIAVHDGPTQDMFVKWVPKLLRLGMVEAVKNADERAAIGLECVGIAALVRPVDWIRICKDLDLVAWMGDQLRSSLKEREPLQLQIVIMCGTMARQLDVARALVPLLEVFLNLLHTMQVDDEFVVQLLYLFLQLLRHKELSDRLMGPQSTLGAYVIDLMHDKNSSIREMCSNALVIIGEHSQDWARRIAAERFRWHNDQWLTMVEGGHAVDMPQMEDDYAAEVMFDDNYDDGFDLNADEPLF
ncbi:unnamed protein product [Auanema sp. JU1783]|nr:unnamed protein product [Auanema sp. JU1783]